MMLRLNSAQPLRFCKVVWRRYLDEVGKFYRTFLANLSKTAHINFYQNRASIVKVMTKNGVFYASQCSLPALIMQPILNLLRLQKTECLIKRVKASRVNGGKILQIRLESESQSAYFLVSAAVNG